MTGHSCVHQEICPNDKVRPLSACTTHNCSLVLAITNSHLHFSMSQSGDRVATNSSSSGVSLVRRWIWFNCWIFWYRGLPIIGTEAPVSMRAGVSNPSTVIGNYQQPEWLTVSWLASLKPAEAGADVDLDWECPLTVRTLKGAKMEAFPPALLPSL